MTDLKISEFADGGTIQDTDSVATVRSGVNTKVVVGSMAAEDADEYGALADQNTWADTQTFGRIDASTIQAATSAGIAFKTNGASNVLVLGAGGGVNATAYGGWNFDAATASTIASFGASKTLVSLPLATYPSLTELSYVKGVTSGIQAQLNALGGSGLSSIPGGRLTLTTGVPVTTTDVTGASTLYYTPYIHNRIDLYTGSAWAAYSFTQRSLALSGLTSGRPYDVFLYDNAGTLTLELTAWTNDSTRATALVYQDGILVKDGALTRRYLGTLYTTGTTTTEDSKANRYLWNYYNRVTRSMASALEATASWSYSTTSYRQANANAANQLNFVVGVSEDAVIAEPPPIGAFNSTTTYRSISTGIGLDSTSVNSATRSNEARCNSAVLAPAISEFNALVAAGKHYLAWLEKGGGTDTQTWYASIGSGYAVTAMTGSMRG
jgi:hypothetical protein